MPLPTFSMKINKNIKIHFFAVFLFFFHISARLSHGLLTHPVFPNTKRGSEFFPCHSEKAKSAEKNISYSQPQSVLLGKNCAFQHEYGFPSWPLAVLKTLGTDFLPSK